MDTELIGCCWTCATASCIHDCACKLNDQLLYELSIHSDIRCYMSLGTASRQHRREALRPTCNAIITKREVRRLKRVNEFNLNISCRIYEGTGIIKDVASVTRGNVFCNVLVSDIHALHFNCTYVFSM